MRELTQREKDFKLWILLAQVMDAMHRAAERETREDGLTTQQAGVLYCVTRLGSRATPARISRWMLRKRNSLTEVLARMERQGLISRARATEGKDLVRITLTKRGKALYRLSDKRSRIYHILAALSPEQREQLKLPLKALRERAFKQIGISHESLFR